MKRFVAGLTVLALTAVVVPCFAFEMPEGMDVVLEISLPEEDPQAPDTLDVSMSNEFLGEGLARRAVKKMVKKARKKRANRTPAKYFPGKGLSAVRVVTYNVGVFQKSGYNKMAMVADMMHEMKADVIGLNELDSCATRTGGVYQLADFASEMGSGSSWNFNFAPAMPYQGGAYGIGIVSNTKYPVLDRWGLVLPKGAGAEPRALSVVEYKKFVIASTHLDHISSVAQVNQVKTLTNALLARYGSSKKPVILCGDMNSGPNSGTLKELKKNWTVVSAKGDTFSSNNPHECIDYILVLNNGSQYKVKHSAVGSKFKKGDVTQASDHLPVYVDIVPR